MKPPDRGAPRRASLRDLPSLRAAGVPEEDLVYVGRPGRGEQGPFGNPIVAARGPCSICGERHMVPGSTLACYRVYLSGRLRTDSAFAASVWDLRGKILLCFCAEDRPCHADALIEAVETMLLGESELVAVTSRLHEPVTASGTSRGASG